MDVAQRLLKSVGDSPLPPVENWNPDYCGELGLQIKANGDWFYANSPFAHQKLQQLFSRIIKKENDRFFLVTPVEKLGIEVEWMPFTIVDFEQIAQGQTLLFVFTDNCANRITLTSPDQWQFSYFHEQQLPTVQVRRNLFASFSRSCYYQLLNLAEMRASADSNQWIINSNGVDFLLGQYSVDEN